jgi:calcineurin-like phosphoesterase family protein
MVITGITECDIWITSDTHYNHKNICRGVTDWRKEDGSIPLHRTRDFPSIEVMNDAIVNGINNVVSRDDILIHLGDWSFGGFNSIYEFYQRLNCKNIHLILGNHDHHIKKNKGNIRDIFLSVDKSNDEYRINQFTLHLEHYPILLWKDVKKGNIHLHGHTHFVGDRRFGTGRRMDVGIDGHPEFRPYNIIKEIIPMMLERPIKCDIDI